MSKNQKLGGARYIGLCLAVIALLAGIKTQASVFPNDAITIFHEQTGEQTLELLPIGEKTILGVKMQQANTASGTKIYCGSTLIAENLNKDYNQDLMMKYCQDAITLKKTGQDTSFLSLTYVPYRIASQPDMGSFSDSLASVSGIAPLKTFGFMTAGDILIALLLFGLIMLNLLTIFLRKI